MQAHEFIEKIQEEKGGMSDEERNELIQNLGEEKAGRYLRKLDKVRESLGASTTT